MSTPLQPIASLLALTEHTHRLLANDLKAIPAERLQASPGGCARAPLHIVAECALLNGYIGEFLTGGGARLSPEERSALLASFDTVEKTIDYLNARTALLTDAIRALDETTLGEISDKPFGRPMSRFAIAQLPATHMMYHDGQLNYIQSLDGDSEMHWG